MKFIKDGVVYETPITMNIGGLDVELTYEQLFGLGYESYDNKVGMTDSALTKQTATVDKFRLLLDSIEVDYPEGSIVEGDTVTLPFRLGYEWRQTLDRQTLRIGFEQVEVVDGIGTVASNPLLFHESVLLVPGAYYSYEGGCYRYVGEDTKNAGAEPDMTEFEEA